MGEPDMNANGEIKKEGAIHSWPSPGHQLMEGEAKRKAKKEKQFNCGHHQWGFIN